MIGLVGDCSTEEVNCSNSDASCLFKLQILTRKEKIGNYQKTYSKTRPMVRQTGSYEIKSCSNYNYVEINKTLYATTTTTSYTTINTITTTTQSSNGTWKYNGRASYSNPPTDTANTHYKFVGADYSYCSDTCTTLPNYYYDIYTYTGGLTSVTSTTTPGDVKSSRSTETTKTTDTTTETSGKVTSADTGKMTVTDSVRLRKSQSTDADIITMIYAGSTVNVVEQYSNGWAKVEYNGNTGYIMSEFLEK